MLVTAKVTRFPYCTVLPGEIVLIETLGGVTLNVCDAEAESPIESITLMVMVWLPMSLLLGVQLKLPCESMFRLLAPPPKESTTV